MKCPSCQRPVDHEAESCYSCGYSELEASERYGSNLVVLNRVHDAAHCLRKQERDELSETLDRLELKFPQMLFCVYLGNLPSHLCISELGFWLLNHGQVRGAEYVRPNENAILVVVDMVTKQIGISLGYFAETLISEEDAYRALTHSRPHLINSEYGEGIEKVFLRLSKVLQKKGRKLRKLSRSQIHSSLNGEETNLLNLPAHLAPDPAVTKEEVEIQRHQPLSDSLSKVRNVILLLLLLPMLSLGGKIEMPEWEAEKPAAEYFLGGGLWPQGLIPDQKVASNAPGAAEAGAGSEEIPKKPNSDAAKFYGPQGLVDAEKAGDAPPQSIAVSGAYEFEGPPAPIMAEDAETPALEPLPPIEGQLADLYFQHAPVDFLVDPQRLLTEQKSNDIKRFLEFHSDESEFHIYIMVLGETQSLPEDIDIKKLHQEWFSDRPTVVMLYYREHPEMTELVFNDNVRADLSKSVFERIRQNCLREGGATDDAPDQVEKMSIELSIQLYWLSRLTEQDGSAAQEKAAETSVHDMVASADAPELLREYAPGIFIEDPSRVVTLMLTLAMIVAGIVVFAMAGWLVLLWRSRDSMSGKPLLFPNFKIVPRLGGEFSGGGFASMSFELNDNSSSIH
ncbi:zinc ribbon domain-containing protein [Verrucomicrobiales bacterium]|jgi:hypothetical protein|nr:zinc ribbon domain-containing protein [Verrucomicrobiales bacterium]